MLETQFGNGESIFPKVHEMRLFLVIAYPFININIFEFERSQV